MVDLSAACGNSELPHFMHYSCLELGQLSPFCEIETFCAIDGNVVTPMPVAGMAVIFNRSSHLVESFIGIEEGSAPRKEFALLD
jgi:hypothetical protein